jgi:predicted O-linked N-acetylglucosamine transferase (SPINDLY family)
MATTGRNDPCPCGSGRKYKQCCLGKAAAPAAAPPTGALLAAGRDHHRAGRLAEAERAYRQVLVAQPGHAEALNLLGLVALQSGQPAPAAELFAAAVAADPRVAGYHSNLGNARFALGAAADAVTAYRAALARDPALVEAHYNLGRCLNDLGDREAAIASYRQALARQPRLAVARYGVGNALGRLGRLREAVAEYRAAVAADPRHADAWCNLGFALTMLGEGDAAVDCLGRAAALQPASPGVRANLALALVMQGRGAEAEPWLATPYAPEAGAAWAHSTRLFCLLYLPAFGPDFIAAAHRQFATDYEAPLARLRQPHANDRDPERRLRIGYVSPNLVEHSVACFLEPVIAHHDRARVEVFCYSDAPHADAVSGRLAAASDHWLACAGWPDARLAERIRADGIDVLVDLAGHTQDNRLTLFARRPAPVQVTWLGYAGTTGLAGMDYRLVTADTDPPGAEAWHSERLLRLPRTLWCFRPRFPAPGAPPPRPSSAPVTFGSANNVAKLSAECLALWARVLGAVPGARLVLTGVAEGSVRDRLRQPFVAAGIDPARITLHGRLPAAEFQAVCAGIDIGLDAFPYAGTTTTCELLWLGVPVVTLAGPTSVARSGAALLRLVGLDDCVADTPDGFVATAVALAADPARVAALRASLPARVAASPLRDEQAMARDLEAAFRAAWHGWCAATPAPPPGPPVGSAAGGRTEA